MPRLINRPRASLAKFATVLAAGTMFTFAAPIVTPTALGVVSAAKAQEPSQFQSILANYGAFQAHAKYGEVWVPARTTVPEGWHPYPACNWVHSKDLGWYFNDKTEWGKIVHHYGRWAHDKELGWVWVKGEEFSPGWVVWRTSDKWVGWAPMPPEADLREISAADFNNDKHWTFMDAKKFGSQCDGGSTIASTPPALYPVIFQQTKLVTEIKFVGGIAIFVLPPPLIINIVDINIGIFPPWSPCFFGAWFWQWNVLINNVIININVNNNQCKPLPIENRMKPIPIISTPPPGPGSKPTPDRRTELTPPPSRPLNPGYTPPSRPLDPPVIRDPGPRLPPVVIDPGRPRPDGPIRIPNGPKPDKPDRPSKPNKPDSGHGNGPTRIPLPPIVKPDKPTKPSGPVITDKPRLPKGPVITDVPPRKLPPLSRGDGLSKPSTNHIPRNRIETSGHRQPVPRIAKFEAKPNLGSRASIPQQRATRGPTIR